MTENEPYELKDLYSSIKTIKPRGVGSKGNQPSRPLLSPITIADVEKFHSRHDGHKLHEDFVYYLTNISSETISTNLQTRIDLENPNWSSVDMDWIQDGTHHPPSASEIEKDDCIVVGDCIHGMADKVLVTDITSPLWGCVLHNCPDYFGWPYPNTMTSYEFLLDVDIHFSQ